MWPWRKSRPVPEPVASGVKPSQATPATAPAAPAAKPGPPEPVPGSFECGGTLALLDPCYPLSGELGIVGLRAKPGTWRASVARMGLRVAEVVLSHDGAERAPITERVEGLIGVDSGMAGVFDQSRFPRTPEREMADADSFYGRCCGVTLSAPFFGFVAEGFVSASGWGDGAYEAFGRFEIGELVAVRLVFMGPEE